MLGRKKIRSVMSSWRSSNVDEMVRAAFAEKGSPLLKEEEHWRVSSIVGLAAVCCGLPSLPLSGLGLMMMA